MTVSENSIQNAKKSMNLYKCIYESIKAGIENGTYESNSYLPTERRFCEIYKVGRITVRRALDMLSEDGMIKKIQGAGNLVTFKKEVVKFHANGISKTIVFALSADFGDKIRQPFVEGLFHHFEMESRKQGYNLIYTALGSNDELPDFLREDGAVPIRGIIFVSAISHKFINAAIAKKIPSILISNNYDNVVSISPDNISGCFDATEYLIKTGALRIAFIAGLKSHHNASKRLIGYKRAMICNGLPVDESYIRIGDWSFQSGYECMISLLEENNNIEGVVAANDTMALGAMRAIMQRGLKIPEQIQVVGFDNIEQSRYSTPPLSTISIDTEFVAILAINMIENQMNGQKISGEIIVPTTFVMRESVGRIKDIDKKISKDV